jgi:hypothetical protein
MSRKLIVSIVGAAALLGWLAPSAAQAQATGKRPGLAATEVSAQSRPRPRTRIRVSPAYPYRLDATDYPVPYPAEFPGPGYVRQCTSWLAAQNRVSGPVITPQMRCWWQPGRSDLKSYP